MKHIVLIFLFGLFAFSSIAQEKYWVFFTDKGPYENSMDASVFVSQRSVERREKQEIEFSDSDLPVFSGYLEELKKLDVAIKQKSKWLNAVSIATSPQNIDVIKNLPFVTNIRPIQSLVKQNTQSEQYHTVLSAKTTIDPLNYGPSGNQVFLVNGQYLHQNGNLGEGMLIAVLDGGFQGVESYSAFDSLWARNGMQSSYNFVTGDTNVYVPGLGMHGMSVLSLMTGYVDGQVIGTAPKATYVLLTSEDETQETKAEEDNWVAAIEYADSVGADIINSSLGYNTFDGGIGNYTLDDLDGRTAITSIAANMAARKGILVVNSAGNEGVSAWQKIITPADADSILTVGAVDANGVYAQFSGRGPTADGRIKPEIVAQGASVYHISFGGLLSVGSGTSFSSPIIAGLSACLWQRHPNATAMEIRDAIIQSADKFDNPDNSSGYGIPNFLIADALLNDSVETELDELTLMPNPFTNVITLYAPAQQFPVQVEIVINDMQGNIVKEMKKELYYNFTEFDDFALLPAGVYIFQVKYNGKVHKIKMIK